MSVTTEKPAAATAIRPFRVEVPDEELADLRRRIAATRWPEPETVPDQSQGVQLRRLQGLLGYWDTEYDWRVVETRLNALPQFVTEIDGLDIHFIHVRSRHENALPLIVTHGWPGSVLELLKVIGPLTDPAAHGGTAGDAFHLVIPSLPGYGFSGRPQGPGWNPDQIARAWHVLMTRLGYGTYVAQGGDWGAVITQAMGRQAPPGLRGIHVNLPGAVPPDVEAALAGAGPVPAMTEQERAVFEALSAYRKSGNSGYFVALTARPQAVGYGLTDSPAGLAAFFLWHPGFAQWSYGDDPEDPKTRDEVLDDITLYWLTSTAASSGAAVLGEPRGQPDERDRDEDQRDLGPGGRHGLPGRRLPAAADLGRARLSHPRLLPRGRSGRPLRRLGTAGPVLCRAPGCIPVTPLASNGRCQARLDGGRAPRSPATRV